MQDDAITRVRALRDRVAAAGTGQAPSAALAAYLTKVERAAHRITDDEVQALLTAGHTEDEVFEATITTAMTTAITRMEAGLAAPGEGTMMRLPRLGTEFRWQDKLKMRVMRLMSGREVPDVVKMHYYLYKLFGEDLGGLFQEAMRGPSEWTVGEREAMAAFVSRLNQCVF